MPEKGSRSFQGRNILGPKQVNRAIFSEKGKSRMRKLVQITTFIIVIALVLPACAPLVRLSNEPNSATPEPQGQVAVREAPVQSVDIEVMNTNPVQVNAIVKGSLTESCARLGDSQVQYDANTFHITVYVTSPADQGCIQQTTPFETTIALDTSGLGPGTYTVAANGVSAVFALQTGIPPATVPATAAPTVAPTPVPTSHGCSDSAAFVSDVSIPDNLQVAPGTAFTKTWRLRNTGTCTWNGQYRVSYISGTTMSQQPSYYFMGLDGRVQPGQTVDVSVGMTAPMQNGSYASYWGLTGRNGRLMPISGGANGNSFFVKIKVDDGSSVSGNVTAVSIDIEPEQGSGDPCTADSTYLVHVYITADGPTKAYYELDSSNGNGFAGWYVDPDNGAHYTIEEGVTEFEAAMFSEGHTKTLTVPFRFVGPYADPKNISVAVRVNSGTTYSAKLYCE